MIREAGIAAAMTIFAMMGPLAAQTRTVEVDIPQMPPGLHG
jgi:hypothetical protein